MQLSTKRGQVCRVEKSVLVSAEVHHKVASASGNLCVVLVLAMLG